MVYPLQKANLDNPVPLANLDRGVPLEHVVNVVQWALEDPKVPK